MPVQWLPSGSRGARTGSLDEVMSGSDSEEGIRAELGKREERKNGTSTEGEGQ